MDSNNPDAHDKEVFNVGSLAVVNADKNPAPSPKPAATTDTSNHLGSVALESADEKLLEPDEHLVSTVYRHPIGIIGVYVEMVAGVGVIVVLVVLALAGTFGNIASSLKPWLALAGLLLAGFIVMILSISVYVYRKSRLLIADKSIVSTVQNSLFSRKVARLSMASVEDVTCDQNGMLQNMLNYGTLTIQTAGQEDNFIFPYCPKPNDVADQILEARQAFVRAGD